MIDLIYRVSVVAMLIGGAFLVSPFFNLIGFGRLFL
jgi:hypothetical protein